MKNRKKQQKQDGRGAARLELSLCACGCGYEQLLDVRHKQKYIEGHGGVVLLERRKEWLKSVLALTLLGRGATWQEAQRAASALVSKALKLAQQLVADSWDYLAMTWRTA